MKRMNINISLLISMLLSPLVVHASENLETPVNSFTTIAHKLWVNNAMPLEWYLHEDGVVNNDVNTQGTASISNVAATAEISAAFSAWQNITTADISVVYSGETPINDSGCDLVNIVTWSDTNIVWPTGAIAAGLTTTYVGPDIPSLNNVNRNVECGNPGDSTNIVSLDPVVYPNGTPLLEGTILDMDMTWNAAAFDFSTVPNAVANVFDLRAVATHEFGHLFGFSHTSMAFNGIDAATMFPSISDTSIAFQNAVRSLAPDDLASAGRGYPDTGFWPDGPGPYTTGAISGWVRQSNGAAAQGVRVWAYPVPAVPYTAPVQPNYEGFSLSAFDWEVSISMAGDYIIKGMTPGDYYLCIVPWANGVPDTVADDQERYNLTTLNGNGHTGFPTECYDDVPSGSNAPDFNNIGSIRRVTVASGETTPHINFVTGSGSTDFSLVMDVSGSMANTTSTPGVTRLDALKASANSFVDFLDITGSHRLGLVQFTGYNDATPPIIPFVPPFELQNLNAASRTAAHNAINSMVTRDWTNIIAGVEAGVNQLTAAATPNDRQILFVFSDGMHNRPMGSNLMDIDGPVVNNDLTLYSLGIGSSLSGPELSQVAANSGGLHIEHQTATASELSKFFISVAASAVDLSTLIDPLYEMKPGESGALTATVNKTERDLVFVMNWDTPNRNQFKATIQTPGGCTIGTVFSSPKVQVRSGDTYRHIRIPLPYVCRRQSDHDGRWTLKFQSQESQAHLTRLIGHAYSSSKLNMYTDILRAEKGAVVEAKLVNEGEKLRDASLIADVVIPTPYSDNQSDDGDKPPPRISPDEERTVRIYLEDRGINGDRKAKDGIYTAILPIEKAGSYRMRIRSKFPSDSGFGTREQVISYFYDGTRIILPKKRK